MLEHSYNIIIDCGVGYPGHIREVVDFLNDTDKRLISTFITTVQMPDAADYDSQIVMHTSTLNTVFSLQGNFRTSFRTKMYTWSDEYW